MGCKVNGFAIIWYCLDLFTTKKHKQLEKKISAAEASSNEELNITHQKSNSPHWILYPANST
jgi:hypothetical protein